MPAYPNGRLPASALAVIPGTSRRIRADLLPGVIALRAAFAAAFGKPLTITDAYRELAEQERIFFDRYYEARTGGGYYGDIRWYQGRRYVRRRGTASAATPGTSNHGWGQALDLGAGVNTSLTSAEYLWMRAHAPALGWTHPVWARRPAYLEPWHWEGTAVPGLVTNPLPGTGAIPPVPTLPVPAPITPEDDDMYDDAARAQDAATRAHAAAAERNAFDALKVARTAAADAAAAREHAARAEANSFDTLKLVRALTKAAGLA